MTMTLTERAANQILRQIEKHGSGIALRIGVKNMGCTGLAHTFDMRTSIAVTGEGLPRCSRGCGARRRGLRAASQPCQHGSQTGSAVAMSSRTLVSKRIIPHRA